MAVRIVGCDSLNEYNSESAGQQLYALAVERDNLCMVLDLIGMQYATSTALGKFVGLHRALRSAGGQLVLSNLSPAVAEALAITRLDRIIEIRTSAEDMDMSGNLRA
jgi:anti-anti-sigma factor